MRCHRKQTRFVVTRVPLLSPLRRAPGFGYPSALHDAGCDSFSITFVTVSGRCRSESATVIGEKRTRLMTCPRSFSLSAQPSHALFADTIARRPSQLAQGAV